MKKRFVALDIETSGFSPNYGARIIEIGLCVVENGEIVDTYSELFNPNLKISKKIETLTGITNDELKDKKTIYERLPYIYKKYFKDEDLVIQNAGFDWGKFLLPELEKLGFSPKNNIIDTKYIANTLLNHKKSNLEYLCKKYNIVNDNPHRALSDAIATAKLFLLFEKELNADTLFDEVYEKEIEAIEEVKLEEIAIYKIKYWEMKIKKETYKRVYVSSNIGTFFYDLEKEIWLFKEKKVPKETDFEVLELAVLRKMALTKDEFIKKYKR